MLKPTIFREYDIRGVADTELASGDIVDLGRALGTLLKRKSGRSISLGRDVRLSSPRLRDALLEGLVDTVPGPEARFEMRESVALAFVAALQHLPPHQRAVLVLRDVLGFHTTEVAGILDSSAGSVKGALQRARTTLDERLPAGSREHAPVPGSARERALVDRFAAAFERGDTDDIVSLLSDDAWVTMPPEPHEYQGAVAIAEFLRDRERARGGTLWLTPTRANGQPAFGCYLPVPGTGLGVAYLLLVLSLDGGRVSAITFFGDRDLFPRFGLEATLAR